MSGEDLLPHNRCRPRRYSRALLIGLGLRHRIELPVELGDFRVSFGASAFQESGLAEIIPLSEQPLDRGVDEYQCGSGF
jgi:hypothetical protein